MTDRPAISPLLTIESESDLAAILAGDYKSALMWLGKELDAQRRRVTHLEQELAEERAPHRDLPSCVECQKQISHLEQERDEARERFETLRLDMAWTPSEQASEIRRLVNQLTDAAVRLGKERSHTEALQASLAALKAEHERLKEALAHIGTTAAVGCNTGGSALKATRLIIELADAALAPPAAAQEEK